MQYIQRLALLGAILFPLVLGGTVVSQEYTYPPFVSVPLPRGYTAHLENPQMEFLSDGTIIATTRPNSGVGTLVWYSRPGEWTGADTALQWDADGVLPIDPRARYALPELVRDNRGRLYVVSVPDPIDGQGGDNRSLDAYLVPEVP